MTIVTDSRPNRCAQQAILTALDTIMNDGTSWTVSIDLEKSS